MINCIVSNVYDKNADIIEQLYNKLVDEKRRIDQQLDLESYVANPISPLNYNLMLVSAAQFKRKDFLMQLLFETTVTDIKIDTQTYIRAMLMIYHSQSQKKVSKELAHEKS